MQVRKKRKKTVVVEKRQFDSLLQNLLKAEPVPRDKIKPKKKRSR